MAVVTPWRAEWTPAHSQQTRSVGDWPEMSLSVTAQLHWRTGTGHWRTLEDITHLQPPRPHVSPAEQPGLQPRCLFPLALCWRDERERHVCTCVFVIIVVVITRLLTTPTQTSFDSSRGFKARLRLECLVTVRDQADLPAFFTWWVCYSVSQSASCNFDISIFTAKSAAKGLQMFGTKDCTKMKELLDKCETFLKI